MSVHVSPIGDDANDGLTAPVKTLKHAIGIAAADPRLTRIILASGTYSASTGETFPYAVPPNVTIAGPAGGGAILAGSKAEPGMKVETGGLQDLDLQDFQTAITVTGVASLKNIRVLTSVLAVQAETDAKRTVNHLDVAGAAGSCASGLVLNGAADLVVTTLTTRNLGSSLDTRDQSAADVTDANLLGDVGCTQNAALVRVNSSTRFAIRNSLLDGGSHSGLLFIPTAGAFQATISKVLIRNMTDDGLAGVGASAAAARYDVLDSELSANHAGAEFIDGQWSLDHVVIKKNKNVGIYLQSSTMKLRHCEVSSNGYGIDVYFGSAADLGTIADPGDNTFQSNALVGVLAESSFAVSAIGNTWNLSVQGTDANGHYPTIETITTATPAVNGNNYSVASGSVLSR